MRNRVNVRFTIEGQEHCEDGIWGRTEGQGQREKVAEGRGKVRRMGWGGVRRRRPG